MPFCSGNLLVTRSKVGPDETVDRDWRVAFISCRLPQLDDCLFLSSVLDSIYDALESLMQRLCFLFSAVLFGSIERRPIHLFDKVSR